MLYFMSEDKSISTEAIWLCDLVLDPSVHKAIGNPSRHQGAARDSKTFPKKRTAEIPFYSTPTPALFLPLEAVGQLGEILLASLQVPTVCSSNETRDSNPTRPSTHSIIAAGDLLPPQLHQFLDCCQV